MRTGTYRDREGNLVKVRRTATGYVITRPDGSVSTIGLRAERGVLMRRPSGRPVSLKAVPA